MTQATSSTPANSPVPAPSRLRIAVTGGSGNVGTTVCQALLARGHEIVVLDRRPPRVEGARFVFIDLRDRQALQPVLEGVDAVAHLGEIPNEHRGESGHDVFVRNVAAGSTVLQTAADLKIQRFIYTSSCQVYGLWGGDEILPMRPEKFPIDENTPLQPLNGYSMGKVANEGFARIISRRQGMPITIFRMPMVLGGGRWLRNIVRWTSTEGWYREHGDGFWTFLHEDDAARAYVLALEAPPVAGACEAYNLTSTDVLGPEPLRERLAAVQGQPMPPLPEDWPERAAPVDLSKARDRLGWVPEQTFDRLAEAARSAPPSAPRPRRM